MPRETPSRRAFLPKRLASAQFDAGQDHQHPSQSCVATAHREAATAQGPDRDGWVVRTARRWKWPRTALCSAASQLLLLSPRCGPRSPPAEEVMATQAKKEKVMLRQTVPAAPAPSEEAVSQAQETE